MQTIGNILLLIYSLVSFGCNLSPRRGSRMQPFFIYFITIFGGDDMTKVGVIMGSLSDWETMRHCCEILDTFGIAYEKKDNMILADGAYGKWLILLDEHKRGPKASFSSKVMKLLSYYDDSIEKYSLALKTDANMDSSWKEISDIAKKRLNMTLLKITPAGNIKEI